MELYFSCNYLPQNIILAGDSAGKIYVLPLSLIQHRMLLPKCIILFSPWTDMTFSEKGYHSKELFDSVLNNEYIHNAKNW